MRLSDHPGLAAAQQSGRPVIPVFVLDAETEDIGAAPKWRLEQAIAAFRQRLRGIGSDLVLRRGKALDCLRTLAEETGAGAVHWTRLYEPAAIARDSAVKAALREAGLEAESHPGHLIFEPWAVAPKSGGDVYRVFTPYFRALEGIEPGPCLDAVEALAAPQDWPGTDALADWALGAGMRRGADVVAGHVEAGEPAAQAHLVRACALPHGQFVRRHLAPAGAHAADVDGRLAVVANLGPRSDSTLTDAPVELEDLCRATQRPDRGRVLAVRVV